MVNFFGILTLSNFSLISCCDKASEFVINNCSTTNFLLVVAQNHSFFLELNNLKMKANKINYANKNQLMDYDVREAGMPTYEQLFLVKQ